MGFIASGNAVLATPDLAADQRFRALAGVESRIRAVLAVPLTAGGRVTGCLAVSEVRPGRQWTDRDVELLNMVAQRSGDVIERARMREERDRNQEAHRAAESAAKVMDHVRQLQASFLPSQPLLVAGWEACGQVIPARHVGGDLFDYFRTGDGSVGLAVADVEGKGLVAGYIMALVKGSLIEIGRARLPAAEALAHVNRVVANIRPLKTVTMFYGEFDFHAGILRYSSAGHPPPLVRRRDGRVDLLEEGGCLFGALAEADYPQCETALGAGDALLLYSDGVTEALDASHSIFGEERLRAVWSEAGGGPPEEAMGRVLRAVEGFRGAAPQSDDITLVVMGRPSR